jgi:hypothetical protein
MQEEAKEKLVVQQNRPKKICIKRCTRREADYSPGERVPINMGLPHEKWSKGVILS